MDKFTYFVHLKGTDLNNVPKEARVQIIKENNDFTAECKKFQEEHGLCEAHVVYFRNLGKVEAKPMEGAQNGKEKSNGKKIDKKTSPEENKNLKG
jgi:hypothetical protein